MRNFSWFQLLSAPPEIRKSVCIIKNLKPHRCGAMWRMGHYNIKYNI